MGSVRYGEVWGVSGMGSVSVRYGECQVWGVSGELVRIEAQATNLGLFSSTAMSKNLSEWFK